MKSKSNGEKQVMIGQTDWYGQAGKRPFPEDGFTPALMTRIEQAADYKSAGRRRFQINKRFAITSLATFLLIGTLVLPFGDWKSPGQVASPSGQSQGAALLPTVSPSTTSFYKPPVGSALFEFSGKKYYMPLPIDRNKQRAFAVETSEGIVWSPPPPMVNYNKPKDTHPTEPYTLYLSSKDQTELSASSATRLYTLPLLAGDSNTYFSLEGVLGVGDYVLITTIKHTLGTGAYFDGMHSIINVKKAVAGETVVPKELQSRALRPFSAKGLFAFDKERKQLIIFDYINNGGGGDTSNERFDLETSNILKPATINIVSEIQLETLTMTYEIDGELRKADIIMKYGRAWGIEFTPQ